MTLIESLDADLKEAMKAKNEHIVSTLRMVRSALKNKQIDLGAGKELSEADAITVVRTMVKQYKDALHDFETAGRTDLAVKQKFEIDLLEHYLPAPIAGEELEALAKAVILETGATIKDIGKTMGMVMKKADGRADGNAVRAVLEKLLA